VVHLDQVVSCNEGENYQDERVISTGEILAVLLELVKEHQTKIEDLEGQVKFLKDVIEKPQ